MTIVSPELIYKHIKKDEVLFKTFNLLEKNEEVQTYLQMSNVMAVNRLMYNDHGPVHSKIVSGVALEILEILKDYVTPSIVKDKIGELIDSKIVVLCGSYLHDIGNAVHRELHHIHGCYLSNPILEKILKEIYAEDKEKMLRIKQEILQCIFSHDENIQCLTIEAGIAKIADGTDMAQGRARIPYKLGKIDIHSLSALSIKKVEINRGDKKPLQILIDMEGTAGVFQVEEVLMKKIMTSNLINLVEIVIIEPNIGEKRLP
jgi:metal-dependent HD superfamily phosphatase/phosphodiesterase